MLVNYKKKHYICTPFRSYTKNMAQTTSILKLRNDFIDYTFKCIAKGLIDDVKSFVDDFILDSFRSLKSIDLNSQTRSTFIQVDEVAFQKLEVEKSELIDLKLFVVEAVTYLYDKLVTVLSKTKTQKKTITIPQEKKRSIQDIFTGLKKVGNNDGSYKNIPSALTLATFSS